MAGKVVPLFCGIEGLPVTRELGHGWDMIRRLDDHLHGIADVKANPIQNKPESDFAEVFSNPTPEDLKQRWSNMGNPDGIDWQGPLPNWSPGLTVKEE